MRIIHPRATSCAPGARGATSCERVIACVLMWDSLARGPHLILRPFGVVGRATAAGPQRCGSDATERLIFWQRWNPPTPRRRRQIEAEAVHIRSDPSRCRRTGRAADRREHGSAVWVPHAASHRATARPPAPTLFSMGIRRRARARALRPRPRPRRRGAAGLPGAPAPATPGRPPRAASPSPPARAGPAPLRLRRLPARAPRAARRLCRPHGARRVARTRALRTRKKGRERDGAADSPAAPQTHPPTEPEPAVAIIITRAPNAPPPPAPPSQTPLARSSARHCPH